MRSSERRLRTRLIRFAYKNPNWRGVILPLLDPPIRVAIDLSQLQVPKLDSEKAIQTYAKHLLNGVAQSHGSEIGKGVSGYFDEYTPDRKDMEDFLKDKGTDRVWVGWFSDALPSNFLNAIRAKDSHKKFYEILRLLKKPNRLFTMLGKNIGGKVKSWFNRIFKGKDDDYDWNMFSELEDGGENPDTRNKDNYTSLRSLVTHMTEGGGDVPGKAEWMLQGLFSTWMDEGDRIERRMEDHVRNATKGQEGDLGRFLQDQVVSIIQGKPLPKPKEEKSGQAVSPASVQEAIQNEVLRQLPEIKKNLDKALEGRSKEEKASLAKAVSGMDGGQIVKQELLPHVVGAIKPTPKKTEGGFLGMGSSFDVKGIISGKYEGKNTSNEKAKSYKGKSTPDSSQKEKKEEKKEETKPKSKSPKEEGSFLEEMGDKKVKNPETGRDIKIENLPADHPVRKQEYDAWKGNKD